MDDIYSSLFKTTNTNPKRIDSQQNKEIELAIAKKSSKFYFEEV